jgi:hypothetical protein
VRRKQSKQAQPSTLTDDDLAFAESTKPLRFGYIRDAFEAAREDNPGKWTKQLLQQYDIEKARITDCRSEAERSKLLQKNRRALRTAQARDSVDRYLDALKAEAQSLKKSDNEFLDIELLEGHVTAIAEALEEHEKISEPAFVDPQPLEDLAWVLVLYLNRAIGPMNVNRARMTHVRAKRSSKSRDRDKDLIKRAIASLRQNPKQSRRSVAHNIAQGLGLKTNTVEKKLALVWTTVQRSLPTNK